MNLPVLYTFRRCPYAMRARMGLTYAGISCEVREILLSEKPESLLNISPKGTVPVLHFPEGILLEESLDILEWALIQSDPHGWNELSPQQTALTNTLIQANDGAFKKALDRYKYPTRYPNEYKGNPEDFSLENRYKVETHFQNLEDLLVKSSTPDHPYLVKDSLSKADIALFPFIRQFSQVDKDWFHSLPHKHLKKWLKQRLEDPVFEKVMFKYDVWKKGDLKTLLLLN